MDNVETLNDNHYPVITIVTVSFNAVEHIEKTILSVIEQRYPKTEYIIIDGGSTDGTIDIIKKYTASITFWQSEKDKGIYDGMNKAIDRATGEWMNFMNCGDTFADSNVLKFIGASKPDADIIYGDATINYGTYQAPFRKNDLKSLWRSSPFCHQASFIKGTLMKKLKYDTAYKIGADQDLFFRAYKSGFKFEYINRMICLFDGMQGTTKRRIIQAIKDKRDIALKYDYSLGKLIYYQFYLAYIYLNILTKRVLGPGLINAINRRIK